MQLVTRYPGVRHRIVHDAAQVRCRRSLVLSLSIAGPTSTLSDMACPTYEDGAALQTFVRATQRPVDVRRAGR
jgi:hypothetical protein